MVKVCKCQKKGQSLAGIQSSLIQKVGVSSYGNGFEKTKLKEKSKLS